MIPDLTSAQLDLLLSLTDGSLSGDALAQARATVDADPLLSSEFARQQEALAFLQATPLAPLTDFEAAHLRRGVLDAVAPIRQKSAPRWAARLLPVAAALAVIVLGIGFVNNARVGDEAGLTDIAAEAPKFAATEAPAATEAAAADMVPSAEMPAAADETEDSAMVAAPVDGATSRVALLPNLGALGPEGAPEFTERLEEYVLEKGYVPSPLFDLGIPCDGIEVDGVVVLEYTVAAAATWDGLDVLILELTEPGGPIVLINPTTCEVVHVYPTDG